MVRILLAPLLGHREVRRQHLLPSHAWLQREAAASCHFFLHGDQESAAGGVVPTLLSPYGMEESYHLFFTSYVLVRQAKGKEEKYWATSHPDEG